MTYLSWLYAPYHIFLSTGLRLAELLMPMRDTRRMVYGDVFLLRCGEQCTSVKKSFFAMTNRIVLSGNLTVSRYAS